MAVAKKDVKTSLVSWFQMLIRLLSLFLLEASRVPVDVTILVRLFGRVGLRSRIYRIVNLCSAMTSSVYLITCFMCNVLYLILLSAMWELAGEDQCQ